MRSRWATLGRLLGVFVLVVLLGAPIFLWIRRDVSDTVLYSILLWQPAVLVAAFTAGGVFFGLFLHWVFLWLSPQGATLLKDGWARFRPSLSARRPDEKAVEHQNELRRGVVEVLGVMYAVVVAFVVVTAWQQFDHTEEVGLLERHDVTALYHVVDTFATSPRRETRYLEAVRVQSLLTEYAHNMIGEWEEMSRGVPICIDNNLMLSACQLHGRTFTAFVHNNRLMDCLIARVTSLDPGQTPRDAVMYQEALRLLGQLVENRNHRRHHYEDNPLQSILWWSLWFGALILIAATYISPREDPTGQLARTATLCGMIGLMFALALVFDYPFSGSGAIEDEWPTVVAQLDRAPLARTARALREAYIDTAQFCPGATATFIAPGTP